MPRVLRVQEQRKVGRISYNFTAIPLLREPTHCWIIALLGIDNAN